MKKSKITFPVTALLLILVIISFSINNKYIQNGDITYKELRHNKITNNYQDSYKISWDNTDGKINNKKKFKTQSPNFILKSSRSYSHMPEYSKHKESYGITLGSGSASAYGRTFNTNTTQEPSSIISYNQPQLIKFKKYENGEPFETNDIQTGNRNYAIEGDPNQPWEDGPIGDAIIPMLIFAFGWIVYTRCKLK